MRQHCHGAREPGIVIPVSPFAHVVGPWRHKFAWLPKRSWDGEWLWLQATRRRRIAKKPLLSGPDMDWWQYCRPEDLE